MARISIPSSGSGAAAGPWVLLYKLTAADMTLTTDQAFTKIATFNEAMLMNVVAMPKTGATSVSCLGGIYNQASKAGTADLTSAASWIPLDSTSSPKKFIPFMADSNNGIKLGALISTGTQYLSLSTGSTGACTADIYIYGYVMS